jgi:hypothetical protein
MFSHSFASNCSAARSLHPQLVSPPNPSMRFVSAQFWAQTGRCRGSCQLKTSRQASQQLLLHFVAVKAFAFACPRVPGRVGPFLRSPFCVHRKRSKTAAVSLTAVEQTLGSLIGGANPLFNGGVGHQFLEIKASISTALRRAGVCQSRGAALVLSQ